MTKQETYDFLNAKNIEYEITEHKAVFSMDEICDVVLPHSECDAKNLFVRDDKKREYFLITVKGNKRVDLKEFRKSHGIRQLSFASAEDLMRFLNLTPGSVTPLGLLNDAEHKVKFFLDKDFLEPPGMIGIHPNENTATVWLKTADLINLIRENGNEVELEEL
ncbi:prolyl-tRNA synthetase associated domain-containing protein [Treponema sp. UBA6852]|uniref:prolyl-tRNA synthetase associated domain-containing protein n=1 Tax=Treponema sp. UBA6852 TaxID=1947744 RepID=UPI000E8A7E74|nr:prolyl-tRNA synthetase associated domain-containing protein [Treponema sp. UBA6852]HBP08771.1 prolyl-tRNA editing protein [Treponema sp.]